MVVASEKTKMEAAQFSLIAVTYFASLVLNQCVRGEKTTWGGRFQLLEGGLYVDVTGNKPEA